MPPRAPINLWDSENGTVATQAAKYEFKLNNPKRRRGPTPSEQNQPLSNTPLQAKGNTNPGNYNSEYNTREYIRDILKGELMGKYAVARELDSFLESIIPEAAMPAPLDEIMDYITAGTNTEGKQKAKIPQLSEDGHWIHFPELQSAKQSKDEVFETSSNEAEISNFVQGVCDSAGGLFKNWPIKRAWSSAFKDKGMKTENINAIRKPDFFLVNRDDDIDADDFGFKNVIVLGEHKEEGEKIEDPFLQSVLDQVNDYAFCAFEAQDTRRFLMAIIWIGNYVQLVYYDRGAVIISPLFNIHENPRAFLHIIIGLTFMADELLGFDPTVVKIKGSRYIIFKGEKYRIKAILYHSLMINGRATTVYYVTKDGVDYVLKDYWALLSRGSTEVDYLNIAKKEGVEGIPDMVGYEDVKIGGRSDSCDHNRGTYENKVNRFHRRILFKGRAAPITTFRSKKELLGAIIDIIECHSQLYVKASILHKDISLYNLMFATCEGSSRKGLLIDYDYSGDMNEERREKTKQLALNKLAARLLTEPPREILVPEARTKSRKNKGKAKAKAKAKAKEVNNKATPSEIQKLGSSFLHVDAQMMQDNVIRYERLVERRGQRTGTHPFIAAALLLDKNQPHRAKFDLESIYYVLLYMATRYVGPGRVQKKGPVPYFIYQWTHPEKYSDQSCAHVKRSHKTETDEEYEKDVLSHLTPYMADLAPMFTELKNALCEDSDESVSHANFKRIVKKMAGALPDKDRIVRKKAMQRDPHLLRNPYVSLGETVRAGGHRKSLISADPTYTLEKVRASGEREELDRLQAMKEEADEANSDGNEEEIVDQYEIEWENKEYFEDFDEFEYEVTDICDEDEDDIESQDEEGNYSDEGRSVSSADTLVDVMKQSLEELGSRTSKLTLGDSSDGASSSTWDNVTTLGFKSSPFLRSHTLIASEDWELNIASTSDFASSSKISSTETALSSSLKLESIDSEVESESDSDSDPIAVEELILTTPPSPITNNSNSRTPYNNSELVTTPKAKQPRLKMTRAKAKQLGVDIPDPFKPPTSLD